ncbi:hydrogenase maturation protease [Streptantibioticus cattleyicolor NRRL 8057 = DSM 46488]|uniref:Hydrogenase maturation protease n=1 Tax=Streptantibioticus cattleyicolor (strain ATCC 35852 / DSM 46488 / JCM 4925 / NBRC 14057 / NRRL 8057) TaxID=1003195 RepID=G8X171_STREN|nr:hydrogenase maturation protease [Streptantibioticus cattleyicolor NRRL 8057 = DSM 46488]
MTAGQVRYRRGGRVRPRTGGRPGTHGYVPARTARTGTAAGAGPVRILVAGVGELLVADDSFGPEVVEAMRGRPVPAGVHVVDFGTHATDLADRLLDGYHAAVLVDAAPRGGRPGTLYLLEPAPAPDPSGASGTARALAVARRIARDEGAPLPRTLLLGCEPLVRAADGGPGAVAQLSAPVRAAVAGAVTVLESLTGELLRDPLAPLAARR